MKNKFKNTKIWHIDNHKNQNKHLSLYGVFKYFVIFSCIFLIIFFGKTIIRSWQIALWFLWQSTVKTVSTNLGEEMIRDDFWNINIMIIWVGWDDHHGWYLADSMIVASWNPEKWAITMISIPRDLYVSSTWYLWRINWLFARGYNKEQNVWSGAQNLINKIQEVLWLDIPYYLVADFQWFKEVVDTIWWIDMYIPNTIHDTTYPDQNLWYQTFHISVWQQTLDGDTALKYARSRHTTSDFSRSQRQQDIIKAIIDTTMQKQNITNVWKLKELHSTYTRMVHTNISLKEIIGMFKYAYKFKHIFSFGLNTYCNYRSYSITDAGCFLYNWNRDAYGWMAVMVPNWSIPSNISFYDYIHRFTFFVAHNQWYLIENPKILIRNAIDKNYASQNWKSSVWWANKLAVKLKKYWFNLVWVDNYEQPITQTTVITYWDDYDKTIESLQFFLPINVVEKWKIMSGQEISHDLEIIIWDDFISHIVQTPFSYEK
jgi:polyisoprenyl-teichoic acid--peptidoglycan teichoic acid transferase